MQKFFAVLATVAFFGQATTALAAPAGLFNKTIRTSFSVTIPARGADGSTLSTPRSVSKTIYISSAGRVFSSSTASNGRQTDKRDRGPDVTSGAVKFDGNRLIGVIRVGSGASQLIVTFDSGFQSCTAQVVSGGEGGRPMSWTGLNGIKYTSTGSATTSNPTCSIQSGNAFAG